MHLDLCLLSAAKVRRGAVGQRHGALKPSQRKSAVVCRRKPQADSELPGEQVPASVSATSTRSRCLRKPSDHRLILQKSLSFVAMCVFLCYFFLKKRREGILTKPAIGVESLFTFFMMPGFNWLIKLHRAK